MLPTAAVIECIGLPQVLQPAAAATYGRMSLGAYLARHGYSEAFKRNYLLPMCAAVWSVPNAQVGSPRMLAESYLGRVGLAGELASARRSSVPNA